MPVSINLFWFSLSTVLFYLNNILRECWSRLWGEWKWCGKHRWADSMSEWTVYEKFSPRRPSPQTYIYRSPFQPTAGCSLLLYNPRFSVFCFSHPTCTDYSLNSAVRLMFGLLLDLPLVLKQAWSIIISSPGDMSCPVPFSLRGVLRYVF